MKKYNEKNKIKSSRGNFSKCVITDYLPKTMYIKQVLRKQHYVTET